MIAGVAVSVEVEVLRAPALRDFDPELVIVTFFGVQLHGFASDCFITYGPDAEAPADSAGIRQ